MGERKTKYFEEAPGVQSITRVAFFIMILTALYIAVYEVMTTGNFSIVEFTTISTTAAGLKLFQKSQENKRHTTKE